MKLPSLGDQSPEKILSNELSRLSTLSEDKSRIHGQFILYTPDDSDIPYSRSLSDGEILVSNAMGDREAYRYRSVGENIIALVNPEDNKEVITELRGDSASQHAEFLANFGESVSSQKTDEIKDLHFKMSWLARQVDDVIGFGLKMGANKPKTKSSSIILPGLSSEIDTTITSVHTTANGPLIVINPGSDSEPAVIGFAQKNINRRLITEWSTKNITHVHYSIVHHSIEPKNLQVIQRLLSPELIPTMAIKSTQRYHLPTTKEAYEDWSISRLLNPIKALRKRLYISRSSEATSTFEKRLESLQQAAQDKDLNPNLAKFAQHEFVN